MKAIFVEKSNHRYNLRSEAVQDFESMNIRKVSIGEDSLRYLGCKIWKLIPQKIRKIKVIEYV